MLLGTLFPVLVEVVGRGQVTVGAPYFDRAGTVPFLVLLALMGGGPLLAWRRSAWEQLRGRLAVPVAAAALAVVAAVATGTRSWAAAAVFGLAALVLVANAGELGRITRSFARSNGGPRLAAFPTAVVRNRRLVGSLVAHSGAAIAACAIAASAFASQTEVSLERGQRATFAGYTLRYEGLQPHPEAQRMVLRAPVGVSSNGRDQGRLLPALNLYPSASAPIPTPAIRYGPLTDLYVSVLGFDENGQRATFRVLLNPGVSWLWVGGATIALGGLLSAWPRRRRAPTRRAATQRAAEPPLAEVG